MKCDHIKLVTYESIVPDMHFWYSFEIHYGGLAVFSWALQAGRAATNYDIFPTGCDRV